MADIVLTGGGTGGHLYPALSVAEAVRALRPATQILFIGTPDRIEARVVPAEGWPFVAIPAEGLSRSPLQATRAVARLGLAVVRARTIFKREKPRVVLGTGGYVSAPAALAAHLSGIPVVLHEQNVRPGKVNAWIARWATAVVVSLPGGEAYYPRRVLLHHGNPIRGAAFNVTRAEARRVLGLPETGSVLLVTGGSQGAKRINDALVGVAQRIMTETDWRVVHVTGPGTFEATKQALCEQIGQDAVAALPSAGATETTGSACRWWVAPYLEAMPAAIVASDLVFNRAGATTLAELTATGKPMVLVPYPYAGGHQRLNALAAVAAGAAIELPDAGCTPEAMAALLLPLLSDGPRLAAMATASAAQGKPDAAEQVARLLLRLAFPQETW